MYVPKLRKSKRSREYSSYSQEVIDQIVYGYLFEGKSHRKLDEEYIKTDSNYSKGYQSMGVLHFLGIRGEFKSIFQGISIDKVICELEGLDDLEYEFIIKALKRVVLKNEEKLNIRIKNYWMVSANSKIYKHAESFQERGFIDWRQKSNFEVGDIIYIYCTRPIKKVMFKTMVERNNMKFEDIVDDREFWISLEEYEKSKSGRYCRLRLLEKADNEERSLDLLLQNGLKIAPQGSVKLHKELVEYLNNSFNNYYANDYFPDLIRESGINEGIKKTVVVNKYERSSVARSRCIESKGCYCHVCGIDFEKVYGEIGKGFIHVHHLVPLSKINESYKVNYIKDLIPVCPNCHSMLHRTLGGEEVTVERLRYLLAYQKLLLEEK